MESPPSSSERDLWLLLAELFFLDNQPGDYDFDYVARMLKEASWDREKTKKALIELVAPVAGANVGYLMWPVIGVWEGFDKDYLCRRIESRAIARRHGWKSFYQFADWYSENMLNKLGMERLLSVL